MTLPQPRSAPMCEHRAAITATVPLLARKATNWRPRMRLERGRLRASPRQSKYHDAGYSGKELSGGGEAELFGPIESLPLLRPLMSKSRLSDKALGCDSVPEPKRVLAKGQAFREAVELALRRERTKLAP